MSRDRRGGERKRTRESTTEEEKHIGHHLFITLTPSVHCQGEREGRKRDGTDEDSKARVIGIEERVKKQAIGSVSQL